MFHRLLAALRRLPSSRTSAAPHGGRPSASGGLAIAVTSAITLTILAAAGALWLLLKFTEVSDRLAIAMARRLGWF